MIDFKKNFLDRFGCQNISLIFLFVVFIHTFYSVWRSLILSWYHIDAYSHGFIIVPISLYIAWTKKKNLIKNTGFTSSYGIIMVVLTLMIYIFSRLAGILTLQSVSMVMFIIGSVYFLFGANVLKQVIFPLFLLFLMIPVPSQIYSSMTIPLQLFVSKISASLLILMNIPVLREGNVILLPEITLEVVQACSGLRSMTTLVTLSAILGYYTLNKNLLRCTLIALGVPVSLLVNIIRILIIIIIFQYFNFNVTKGIFHTMLGILVFGISLILIFAAGKVLSKWDKLSIVK